MRNFAPLVRVYHLPCSLCKRQPRSLDLLPRIDVQRRSAACRHCQEQQLDILSLTHHAGWNGRHACKLPTAFLPLRRPPSAFFSRSWPWSHAPRRSCNRHANVTAQPLSDACLNRSVCRCGEINWHALSFKAVVSEFVCKSG